MNNDNFFVFNSTLTRGNAYAPLFNQPLVDYDPLIMGIYENITLPVPFKIRFGQRLNDLVDTTAPPCYLISDRFKKILEENSITGWRTFPITLLDKQDNQIHGYHGFSITGTCGFMNYESSQIIQKQHSSSAPIVTYYQGITVNDWDGNDFFIPKGCLSIFITPKIVNIIQKNKLTNIKLTNSLEYTENASLVGLELKNQNYITTFEIFLKKCDIDNLDEPIRRLSGHTPRELHTHGFFTEMDDFLTKELSKKEIFAKIKDWCSKNNTFPEASAFQKFMENNLTDTHE